MVFSWLLEQVAGTGANYGTKKPGLRHEGKRYKA